MHSVMLHSVTNIQLKVYPKQQHCIISVYFHIYPLHIDKVIKIYSITQDYKAADLCITRKKVVLYCCWWYCWY